MSLQDFNSASDLLANARAKVREIVGRPGFLEGVFNDLFQKYPDLESIWVAYGAPFNDGDYASPRVYVRCDGCDNEVTDSIRETLDDDSIIRLLISVDNEVMMERGESLKVHPWSGEEY